MQLPGEKTIQAEGRASGKVGMCLVCLINRKEAGMAGADAESYGALEDFVFYFVSGSRWSV